ncbi:helix-turn-helix transcriptional regulator [Burkholderia multivorans]|uniref:helix-turn-helix domain-containing protein n=1 Tax=Burkholderia multivorans TaxID=87883 RepID=UPI002019D22E|nr:helix-turn-helix transcriptional regulator [Burkholderia multivorans]MCO1357674.1 helix-turn-helix transcriptional regulator [Burkholderia multivorans]UQO97283.1 helix-turn-helix transcriptional regulator [Burkholderia multivorans]
MEAPDNDFPVQDLLRHLLADTRSSSEIARLSGVSQPTVSRLRLSKGQRLRRSAPFNKLCSFYGLDTAPARRRYNDLLRAAIVDAWDGSDEHGRALLVVIQGLKDLQAKADDG